MKILGACLLVLSLVVTAFSAQNKPLLYILPSDDELFESYLIGEITYDQYLSLLDIISNNIHPGEVKYLDNIPVDVLEKYLLISPESDFLSETEDISEFRFKHAYATYVDDNPRSKYQTNLSYKYNKAFVSLTLRREFSGRERFLNRSVTVTDYSKKLKKIQVGNFSKKFGLGLLIGYHGKNVSYADEMNSESFLFPDYGGFNGLSTEWMLHPYRLHTVSSYVRDEEFSFITNGVSIERKYKKSSFSLQAALTQVKNRISNISKSDLKSSLFMKTSLGKIQNKSEISFGTFRDKTQYAAVTDNRTTIYGNKIQLEGWFYSKDYSDFSGAGRTSLLSEKVELEDIDYSYYSKRANQEGFELTILRDINRKLMGKIAQQYAYKSKDSTEMQFYGQLKYQYHIHARFSYDFSYRQKERYSIKDGSYIKRIHRITGKFSTKRTSIRVYLQYESKTEEDPTLGLFTEFRYKPDNFGLLQLWCNYGRYNLTTERIDYIYLFVRHIAEVSKLIKLEFKLSHRYQRESSDKITNQFSISFEGVI